jgi:hypothetical protein
MVKAHTIRTALPLLHDYTVKGKGKAGTDRARHARASRPGFRELQGPGKAWFRGSARLDTGREISSLARLFVPGRIALPGLAAEALTLASIDRSGSYARFVLSFRGSFEEQRILIRCPDDRFTYVEREWLKPF